MANCPIIQLKNLTKEYVKNNSKKVEALSGIDLEIYPGEIFGIIGKSGAGKSTLLRCLLGLESATSGEVLVEGENLLHLSLSALEKKRLSFGTIFQNFRLLASRTALKNVTLPLEIAKMSKHDREKRASYLLDLVGLGHKKHNYPATLSGGEQQRVAIARALANQPRILFCDEATSALDPANVKSLLHLLLEIKEKFNLTIVLITHQMEVIREICTRVAVLEGGRIVEQGNVADLFASPAHSTTKQFMQQLGHSLPQEALDKEGSGEFLRLSFRGEKAKKPLISRLIRHANVEINILAGSIDALQGEVIGHLIIELVGDVTEKLKAHEYLQNEQIIYERLS